MCDGWNGKFVYNVVSVNAYLGGESLEVAFVALHGATRDSGSLPYCVRGFGRHLEQTEFVAMNILIP